MTEAALNGTEYILILNKVRVYMYSQKCIKMCAHCTDVQYDGTNPTPCIGL